MTRLPDTGAPDADFQALKAVFDDSEIVWLTMLVAAINSWNRIAVGFRAVHPNDKHLAVKEAA